MVDAGVPAETRVRLKIAAAIGMIIVRRRTLFAVDMVQGRGGPRFVVPPPVGPLFEVGVVGAIDRDRPFAEGAEIVDRDHPPAVEAVAPLGAPRGDLAAGRALVIGVVVVAAAAAVAAMALVQLVAKISRVAAPARHLEAAAEALVVAAEAAAAAAAAVAVAAAAAVEAAA